VVALKAQRIKKEKKGDFAMDFNRTFLCAILAATLSTPGIVQAQSDTEQSFGAFKSECKTDQMTDKRDCQIQLHPGPSFFIENGIQVFLVFISPNEAELTSVGFARRLRVDKNLVIAGDCIAAEAGLCLFKNKAEASRFMKEMESGKILHVDLGSKILDFDLEDYRKALAAYREMKKLGAPKP
jgi:hypothetical protein